MARTVTVYSTMTKANKDKAGSDDADKASQSSKDTPDKNATCRVYKNSALQTLNRWLPDDDGNLKGTYYSIDAFKGNVEVWNGVPIVFANEHPDVETFANKETRKQALEDVKGRIVGKTSNARIEMGGHPQLVVEMQICDEQANKLWDAGKLSLSNAFQCIEDDKGVILGEFVANHVLVFEENFDQGDIPRDLASKVAKQKVNPMQATEQNAGREFSRKNVDELKGWKTKLDEVFNGLNAWLTRADPPESETEVESKAVPEPPVPKQPVKEVDKAAEAINVTANNANAAKASASNCNDEEENATKKSDSNCDDSKENAKESIDEVADDSEEPEDEEAEEEADDFVKEPAKKNTLPSTQADAQAPTKAEVATTSATATIANTASGDAEMDEKMKEELNTLKAQKEAMEKELNAFKEQAFEAQFQTFLANVKPGKKEKAEDVENIRKLYRDNPRELLNKASEMLVTGEGETKATGKPFVGVSNKADKPNLTLGGLDPKTNAWKGLGLQ